LREQLQDLINVSDNWKLKRDSYNNYRIWKPHADKWICIDGAIVKCDKPYKEIN
jgi:hypothetical protein